MTNNEKCVIIYTQQTNTLNTTTGEKNMKATKNTKTNNATTTEKMIDISININKEQMENFIAKAILYIIGIISFFAVIIAIGCARELLENKTFIYFVISLLWLFIVRYAIKRINRK